MDQPQRRWRSHNQSAGIVTFNITSTFTMNLLVVLIFSSQMGHLVTVSAGNTTCKEDQYKCPFEDKCVPRRWICDGSNDCRNGDDEKECRSRGFCSIYNPCLNGGTCQDTNGDVMHSRYTCACTENWTAYNCGEACHCYGGCQNTPLHSDCPYGCQLGWMGYRCSRRKLMADVDYFCSNSPANGPFVQFRLDRKGVEYIFIHAVDNQGKRVEFCPAVQTRSDGRYEFIDIMIRDKALTDENCAGEKTASGKYQLRIKLQEREGVVSRLDQIVVIECDFSQTDPSTFHVSGEVDINPEPLFRQSVIRRPVEVRLNTIVTLSVLDAATGQEASQAKIGTPVYLKIQFGGQDVEDKLSRTRVTAFDCVASSPSNNATRRSLIGADGCPVAGSPIPSPFTASGNNSLVTSRFPLFGLDRSEAVVFHCSYALCFRTDSSCATFCSR